MVDLSIIVPVYNVEKYLSRCIESILRQSFSDFELLLIDDGSTDESSEICDKYATEDARVKVVHKKNGGVSTARNTGLDLATGQFIGFVDADDYVSKDMFGVLISALEEHDAEVACCDLAFIDEYESIQSGEKNTTILIDGETTFAEMLRTNAFLRMGVWNKVYRSELLNKSRFLIGRHMSEDLLFLIETILPAKKVAYVRQPLYYYFRQREGAATQKKYGEYEKQRIEATQHLVEVVREKYVSILPQAISYKCINGDLTALNKMIAEDVVDKEMIAFVKKDLRNELKDIIFSNLNLVKKIQLLIAAMSFSIYKFLFGLKR